MTLPNFLVVGAMKSGTTTLYRDLESHAGVQLFEKEASPLLSAGSVRKYERGFTADDRLRGDVSTHYTMRPHYDGAAERAAKYLPADTKVVYIVRDPVRRAVSHFLHWSTDARFEVPEDVNDAVREVEELTAWGGYGTQIEPWLDAFGPANVRLIRFEDYVADRGGEFAGLCRWLGLDPAEATITQAAHNRSEGKLVLGEFWAKVRHSPAYEHVRRFLPQVLKEQAKRAVMRPAETKRPQPSEAAIAELVSRLRPEVAKLRSLFGPDAPTWEWAEEPAETDAVAA